MLFIVNSKDLEYSQYLIKNQENINDLLIKKINYKNNDQLINEIGQIDLFNSYKNFFIFNNNWFDSNKEFIKNLEVIKILINNYKDYNFYFFYKDKKIDIDLINEKVKDIKLIKTSSLTEKNKINLIKNLLNKNINLINDKILNFIIESSSSSFNVVHNEINKLNNYLKIDNNQNDIKCLISNYNEFNIFKLAENILLNDINLTFKIYFYLIKNNYDEIAIMNILISSFINIYYLLNYKFNFNFDNFKLSKTLNIPIFVVNEQIQKLNNIKYLSKIKKILNDLYIYDQEVKNNNDKKILFKNLLLKWID